jgi:hypothetical protein
MRVLKNAFLKFYAKREKVKKSNNERKRETLKNNCSLKDFQNPGTFEKKRKAEKCKRRFSKEFKAMRRCSTKNITPK